MTTTSVSKAIAEARSAAFQEAKANHRWVWSRGTWLATVDAKRNQCEPSPGADPSGWDGKKVTEIPRWIEEWTAKYPNVEAIYVEGGYDGGEDIRYRFDDYEPWASSWEVKVWDRATGYQFKSLAALAKAITCGNCGHQHKPSTVTVEHSECSKPTCPCESFVSEGRA